MSEPERRPRRPRTWGALGCILIGLCGPMPAPWVTPGLGPAQGAPFYRYCWARADAAFRHERQIDQDILATRGNDWQRAGTLGGERASLFAEAVGRADAVFALCMRAQGVARPG
jgi:hypothetical protein